MLISSPERETMTKHYYEGHGHVDYYSLNMTVTMTDKVIFVYIYEVTWSQVYPNIGL